MTIKLKFYQLVLSTVCFVSELLASELAGIEFVAKQVTHAPKIDGVMETVWQQKDWHPIDQLILGERYQQGDFAGRFKLAWDKERLYILAEITDNILFDQHADPLSFYWDDDCLEVFIDEDGSGGEHQYNYNAFAYHVALDNQVVDLGEKTKANSEPFLLFNDHIESRWQRDQASPHRVIWELAIKVFDDSFQPNNNSKPVLLHAGKKMGFMLAYCDNDGSEQRESFIGSTEIKAVNGDKNLGYKTADVFARLSLVK